MMHNLVGTNPKKHVPLRGAERPPSSIFDNKVAQSFEEGEINNDQQHHHVLRVQAVITKQQNNKENKMLYQQQHEAKPQIDRSSYITKYASMKEMELEYLSQKNRARAEQEMKLKAKGPKDFSDRELSPNVINIQTITGQFGNGAMMQSPDSPQAQVMFSLQDQSLMPSPSRMRKSMEQQSPSPQRRLY